MNKEISNLIEICERINNIIYEINKQLSELVVVLEIGEIDVKRLEILLKRVETIQQVFSSAKDKALNKLKLQSISLYTENMRVNLNGYKNQLEIILDRIKKGKKLSEEDLTIIFARYNEFHEAVPVTIQALKKITI